MILLFLRVNADFECINQTHSNPKVLFSEHPIAVGFFNSTIQKPFLLKLWNRLRKLVC